MLAIHPLLSRRPIQSILAFVVSVLSGCSDPAAPLPRMTAAVSSARVYQVYPTGTDDTENLRNAIAQATAAGPGSTISLGPGEFRTNFLILNDFRGTIRGHGIGVTVLRNLDRLDFGNVQQLEGVNPTYENPWPVFITAVGGNVELRDMTIRIVGTEPTMPYSFLGATWDIPQYIVRITGERADSRITRVRLEGGPGTMIGFNTFLGVYWAGTLDGADPLGVSGVHELSSSQFDGVPFPIGSVVENSRITIGGTASQGNQIHNSLFGLVINDAHNSTVNVSHNRIAASWTGVRLWQGYFHEMHPEVSMPAPVSARFDVSHNQIVSEAGAEAITVRDAGLVKYGTKQLAATIEGNNINMQGGCAPDVCAGINVNGAAEVLLAGNRLRGSADAGILLGRRAATFGSRIVGNDLLELDSRFANVVLGRFSSDNVVGGDAHGSVLDLGTDNQVGPASMVSARPGVDVESRIARERATQTLHGKFSRRPVVQ